MRVEFHPAARAELRAAARYYERETPGLGRALVREVRRAADRLRTFPELGAPMRSPNRRHLVRRFPYALVYRVEAERIFVLAVMHLRRRPEYWRDRE